MSNKLVDRLKGLQINAVKNKSKTLEGDEVELGLGNFYIIESTDHQDDLHLFLRPGDKLWSKTRKYYAEIDAKGSLVLYNLTDKKEEWRGGKHGQFLCMLNDGNLALYSSHIGELKSRKIVFESDTNIKKKVKGKVTYSPPYRLMINRGLISVFDNSDNLIWNSPNFPDTSEDYMASEQLNSIKEQGSLEKK